MNDVFNAAGMGHNQPPAETEVQKPLTLAEMLEPEHLREELTRKYAAHQRKVADLMAGAARFCLRYHADPAKGSEVPDTPARGAHFHLVSSQDKTDLGMLISWDGSDWKEVPDRETVQRLLPSVVINDEELAARVTSLTKQIKDNLKVFARDHKSERDTFNDANKVVQDVMKVRLLDPLDTLARSLESGPLNDYQRRKDEAERLRREAEAERARKEAEQAAAAALATQNADLIDNAIEAAKTSEKAERKASAPVSERARVVGAVGGVSVATKVWKFRVVDRAKIPEEYWLLDEQRLGQIARTMKENASVPGVEFYSETKTGVR